MFIDSWHFFKLCVHFQDLLLFWVIYKLTTICCCMNYKFILPFLIHRNEGTYLEVLLLRQAQDSGCLVEQIVCVWCCPFQVVAWHEAILEIIPSWSRYFLCVIQHRQSMQSRTNKLRQPQSPHALCFFSVRTKHFSKRF